MAVLQSTFGSCIALVEKVRLDKRSNRFAFVAHGMMSISIGDMGYSIDGCHFDRSWGKVFRED
jgi:hypothetical protein